MKIHPDPTMKSTKKAKDFFMFKGYGAWFEPSLPGRIGQTLMGHIHDALKGGVVGAAKAICILENQHLKNVHRKHESETEPYDTVVCRPTAAGREAAEHLQAIIDEIQEDQAHAVGIDRVQKAIKPLQDLIEETLSRPAAPTKETTN